jgi:mannose 2-epimerase
MTQLPQFVKNQLKLILEPTGRAGLGHTLPLLFWQGYARLKETKTRGESAPAHLTTQYPAAFFLEHLTTHLLPFWSAHGLDTEWGGYITHLNRQGQVYDDSAKYAAMQARLIYAFSAGHALQPEGGYLLLARHGVDFLTQFFWDAQYGGWYKSVQRNGQVISDVKHLFDQSYVLIGLTEYYRVTSDPAILDYLTRTYQVLEKHAWDEVHLGYYESCHLDWTRQSNRKTICIQVDMLRAVLALHHLTGESVYRQRLVQLADLITGQMCDPDYGCVLETFHPDWCYAPAATRDQIQIGHNLKGAWLLLRVNALEPNPIYVQAATRMVEFCLRYGWDQTHGGFFQQVYRTGPLASPVKQWWPECEGLTALISLYQLTGETHYRDFFQALTAFTFTHFVDSAYGEWFTTCQADGTPLDDHKGGTYKSAYHTVQACVEVWQKLNSDLL